jgi:hypothetical protein
MPASLPPAIQKCQNQLNNVSVFKYLFVIN